MKRFITLSICIVFLYGFVISANPKFVVVIDAGHGGKDVGATRGVYKEKEINLNVSKALGELIEANFDDVKVVYTRKTDVFVDLDKRAQIANKAKANLFISIHTNSTQAKSTNASGADTYILGLARSAENLEVAKRENSVILMEDNYTSKYEGFDPNSPESYIIFEFMTNKFMEQSLQFAEFVQRDVKNVAKRTDRGVRQAGFLVLRKTSMPSVLIELGFINNPTDAQFLNSRLGQRSMATAIYSGFKRFKREFDKKQGVAVAEKRHSTDRDETEINEGNQIYNADNQEHKSLVEDVQLSKKKDSTDRASKEVLLKDANQSSKLEEIKVVPKEEGKLISKDANKIEYRVQFLVSPKKLDDNSQEFRGLSPVKYYKEGSSYKYTFGSTSDWNEVLRIQKKVRAKFKDAFVLEFKNGERVK